MKRIGRGTFLRVLATQLVRSLRPVWHYPTGKLAVSILSAYVIIGIFGPQLVGDPFTNHMLNGEIARRHAPGTEFLFGTNNVGESIFTQTIISFRTSLLVGGVVSLVVVAIGVNIGMMAGYFGGATDSIVVGTIDIIYGIPLYPLAIVFVAMFGTTIQVIMLILMLVLWTTFARITRSETLKIREEDFIKTAIVSGNSRWRIMYGHILPHLIPLITTYFIFAMTWTILLEASLSFLGLGDPNAMSWGYMMRQVFESAAFVSTWWWLLAPSIALSLLIWSLFMVGRIIERESIDQQYIK